MFMSSMPICEVSKEPSFSRQANLAETQQSIEPSRGRCTAGCQAFASNEKFRYVGAMEDLEQKDFA